MELRHYIFFAIATIVLQLFIYIFNRTLFWLFSGKLRHGVRYFLGSITFMGVNTVIFLTIFRIHSMFRLSALLLVLLLFSTFVSITIAIFSHFTRNLPKAGQILRWCYPIGFISLISLALYNAYIPKITHYQVQLDKPISPIRIGMVSDLHLGKLFGGKQLDNLANIFNQEKVDLILIPGDVMDDNVNAYLAEQMQPHLAKLEAPLGIYATLGNHDLFGDEHRIADEIRKAGIRLLQDEHFIVDNRFVLVGRDDDLDRGRPSTEKLLAKISQNLPTFLLDHRPTEIEKHAKLGIDLQVSGHTHKGQVFPASLITKMMYRLDYGYEKIQNSHFVVSSGYGFWGVPFRLGSQSEVVIIDVIGK